MVFECPLLVRFVVMQAHGKAVDIECIAHCFKYSILILKLHKKMSDCHCKYEDIKDCKSTLYMQNNKHIYFRLK